MAKYVPQGLSESGISISPPSESPLNNLSASSRLSALIDILDLFSCSFTRPRKNQQIKDLFLEQLKKTPIIQIACEKLNIARATFYRWKAEDPAFAEASDTALFEGKLLVNDLAESQLIGAVKDRNLQAVTYWLRHHHKDYRNRLEIEGTVNTIKELSSEQKELIKKALEMTGINLNTYENDTNES